MSIKVSRFVEYVTICSRSFVKVLSLFVLSCTRSRMESRLVIFLCNGSSALLVSLLLSLLSAAAVASDLTSSWSYPEAALFDILVLVGLSCSTLKVGFRA